MLYNYLIVAYRNIIRHRLHSFLNILGLSVGLATSLLIMLWVMDETSYDKFIPKAERLFQVRVIAEYSNKIHNWQSVPLPTYEALKTSHSAIVNTVVTDWGAERLIANGEIRFNKQSYWVSEEFLQMFEFEVLRGNPETALADPKSVVITETLGKLLFGDEDPMGKVVRYNNEATMQVSAVLKDIPENSSFQFDFLLPWKLREQLSPWVVENKTNWGNYSFQVFVELDDPTKQSDVIAAHMDMLKENDSADFPSTLTFYNMLRWRLYSNFENGKEIGGRSDYVQLFSAIAIFILLIACINFMNLSTARAERRIREVGIRKSLGSSRGQLIYQFIGESILMALISFAIAILIAQLAIPYYNILVDKSLFIPYSDITFWLTGLGLVFVVGILSGSYPAFYFTSFDPVKTLKGVLQTGKNGGTPRKVLVTLQFAFSILMIISTIVILRQIGLAKNRTLGYEQANLINVPYTTEGWKNYKAIKNELLQTGSVASMTRSNSSITEINSNNFLEWPGKPEDYKVIFTTIVADYDYTETLGIEVLMGRDFSTDFATDTAAIIVNKAALDIMGLEDPLNTSLKLWEQSRKLVGVIDNVLMGNPYEPYNPLFIIIEDWGGSFTIRLNANLPTEEALATVREVFERLNPGYPFEFSFVDEDFDKKFTTIKLTQRLAGIFATLCLFITGLGLFGLASFSAEQKIKEIGIRKVLGASILNLVGLLTKETTVLVAIAFTIAAPISGYLLNNYLERYAIRTTIDWWVYALAGMLALITAIAIVSQQAHKAAKSNPVNALKSE